MKRVLITGAAGFIGRHTLSPLAEAGYEVHAVSRQRRGQSPGGVRWHQSDLLDLPQVAELIETVRPTHLLHLAWVTRHGEYWASAENLNWVQASMELLKMFSASGGRRFVFAGTCAEYDFSFGCLNEELTAASPASLYGSSKLLVARTIERLGMERGFTTAWGRVFHLFGPSEDPRRFVPSIAIPLLEGKQAVCRNGDQLRDFLYVEDVGAAFVALVESEVTGPVNIGSGRPVWLDELAMKIGLRLGGQDRLTVQRSDEILENRILVPDVTKLQRRVGWRPAFTLDAGLEKTIEWWRAQRAVPIQHG